MDTVNRTNYVHRFCGRTIRPEHPRTTAAIIAILLGFGLYPLPAQAAPLARTFVSAVNGSGANNCDRLTPCRTFQEAHDNTLPNGEITVLDPGSYGAVKIDRNISIINDGVGEAGMLVSGAATGITINAPPDAVVTLRGLTIKGIGFGGGNGIIFNSGAALNVENCAIRNLDGLGSGVGIGFWPNTEASLQVTNTVVSDNSQAGIYVFAPPGTAFPTAVLDRVGLYNNGFAGLYVVAATGSSGRTFVTVNDSIAGRNGSPGRGGGFVADAAGRGGSADAVIYLHRSVAAGNGGHGILAAGAATAIWVNHSSTVANKGSGWAGTAGGTIFTLKNNFVVNNQPPIGTVIASNLD